MVTNNGIEWNKSVINKLIKAQTQALEMTGDALLTDIKQEQLMPFDTGNMQNQNTFVEKTDLSKGQIYISSTTPYAQRLYYHPEYNFNKSKNSKAGGKWWENYLTGSKKDWAQKTYAKFYKQLTGV